MIKRRKTNFKVILFIAIAILLSICSFLIFQNKSFKYCSNEKYLLGINDSIKEIKLNLKLTKEELLENIEKQYDYEISDKLLNCKIELPNGEFVGFNFIKTVNTTSSIYYTSIYINRDNQLLLEEEIIKSKDLKSKIYNLLLKQNYYDKFNLSLEWERTSSLETIEKVLIQIKEAYQLYYQTKAEEKFNKNICELNEEELSDINKIRYSLNFVQIIPKPSIPIKIN
jgi:hypothetical protein